MVLPLTLTVDVKPGMRTEWQYLQIVRLIDGSLFTKQLLDVKRLKNKPYLNLFYIFTYNTTLSNHWWAYQSSVRHYTGDGVTKAIQYNLMWLIHFVCECYFQGMPQWYLQYISEPCTILERALIGSVEMREDIIILPNQVSIKVGRWESI
jgi:hypothetical protein